MDHYITGNAIRELREKKKITQKSLAQTLGVSDKTISKWETGKGIPISASWSLWLQRWIFLFAELIERGLCDQSEQNGKYASQCFLCMSRLRQCHSYAWKMRGKLLRHYTACTRGGGNGRCTQFLNRTGGG